jgi:hypothetical protein
MAHGSDTRCGFCGRKASEGGTILAGESAAICAQCIRAMYWKIQEQSRCGRCWRALGWHRAQAEIDVRAMLALVPSVALAWITVGAPWTPDFSMTPWFGRVVAGLAGVAVGTAYLVALMVAAEGALAGRRTSKILLWSSWVAAGGAIWWSTGWTAAAAGSAGASLILYLVLRRLAAQMN